MMPVLLLVGGGYLVFLAVTDQLGEVITGIAGQPKAANTPNLYRYLIGGAVVSIPVVILEQNGNNRGAWQYTTLVILSLLIFYYKNVSSTAAGLNRILRS
jgi:hypothetical protein